MGRPAVTFRPLPPEKTHQPSINDAVHANAEVSARVTERAWDLNYSGERAGRQA